MTGSASDGSDLAPATKPQPDGTLLKALARAWRWQRMLDEGVYATVSEIGGTGGVGSGGKLPGEIKLPGLGAPTWPRFAGRCSSPSALLRAASREAANVRGSSGALEGVRWGNLYSRWSLQHGDQLRPTGS